MRICEIDGCERKYCARGMCKSHYYGARNSGTLDEHPTQGRKPVPVEDRFWKHVNKTGGCWIWTANIYAGYGRVRAAGRMKQAHRVAYEMANGSIPEGFQIDHMCMNRACVNPAHLRLATAKQNREHMSGARSDSKSGIRGVSWSKREGKWVAHVRHHGTLHTAGFFEDIKDAEAAVIDLRMQLFTHNLLDRRSFQ